VSKAKLTDAENFDGSGTVHIGSGINNAVLIAVALFGALLSGVFWSSFNQKVGPLALPPAVRTDIDRQRSKLVAVETEDLATRQAIQQSLVSGYRATLWVVLSLAIASSLSAAAITRRRTFSRLMAVPTESAAG